MVSAAAESQSADKSGYTLFNPTPNELVRELSPDRPDKTDSPRTVDAGHFSVEMDFFNFGRFRDEDNGVVTRTHVYQAAPMNLKVGLLNSVDLQAQISPYSWKSERTISPASQTRTTGFGDVIPRLKVNLVGNDGEGFALAVMPFVKIPTGRGRFSSDEFEGGLKIPYAFGVPDWEIGLQAEVDVNHDQAGSDYHPHIVNSISIGRPIWGRLGYYVEYFSDVSTEPGAGFVSTFDTWFTYSVNKNLRLEAGVYIGLTRTSEQLHPFVGMSFRY
jgi:hypothetical protein